MVGRSPVSLRGPPGGGGKLKLGESQTAHRGTNKTNYPRKKRIELLSAMEDGPKCLRKHGGFRENFALRPTNCPRGAGGAQLKGNLSSSSFPQHSNGQTRPKLSHAFRTKGEKKKKGPEKNTRGSVNAVPQLTTYFTC